MDHNTRQIKLTENEKWANDDCKSIGNFSMEQKLPYFYNLNSRREREKKKQIGKRKPIRTATKMYYIIIV